MNHFTQLAATTCVSAAIALFACGCTVAGGYSPSTLPSTANISTASPSSTTPASPASATASTASASASSSASSASSSAQSAQAIRPATYATGWLIAPVDGIGAGEPVSILSLPDMDVPAHRDGQPVPASDQRALESSWPNADAGEAIIAVDGSEVCVPADLLLVNLPDVMPEAVYDIVYSYSSTSNCAGQAIPGVTGERIVGYAQGTQNSAYWNGERFAVPCAYRTALKAKGVCAELADSNMKLLVYDAYRPMTAQNYLSDAFAQAYASNPEIQAGIGGWDLAWYVADGPSGHNFGTDLDVGVCDMDGDPIAMPSAFDSFDNSGHLTDAPMNSGAITPASYRDAVASNDACMALHTAFVSAGFEELASEWWHFGDPSTQSLVISNAGSAGLDFVALMPED